ncbi:MAG: F0F1 ATP synthase subunit A [Patescibacteria group bacterium]|nr:F0F1 ATP synthase subunit A [Patescibacteria group bacterium]
MAPISLRAEEIFHIGPFPVTNSVLLAVIVFVLLVIIGLVLRRRLMLVPGAVQNIVELVIEGALNLMDSVLGDRRTSEKYLPLVLTIFLFVLFSNWLGLLPGVGSIMVNQPEGSVPLLRSPASDLNFTLALALIAVTFANALGIAAIGFKKRASVFFNFKGPIDFFVGILELVSEFAKIISFSFRLFGNVFAGEVLLAIMAFLVPYLAPLPFMFLEIFVGFIQAFIFGMLTLVFVAMATAAHGEGHEAEAPAQ